MQVNDAISWKISSKPIAPIVAFGISTHAEILCRKLGRPSYNCVDRQSSRIHIRDEQIAIVLYGRSLTIPFLIGAADARKDDRCFRRNRSYDVNVIMQSRAAFVHKVVTRIINCTWRAQIRGQVRRLPKVTVTKRRAAARRREFFSFLFFPSCYNQRIADYVRSR